MPVFDSAGRYVNRVILTTNIQIERVITGGTATASGFRTALKNSFSSSM